MSTQPLPEDAWAWAHVEDPAPVPELAAEQVAGIMVVHNAEEWLHRTLRALTALDPPPGRLIVVDNGSTDESSELLDEALDSGLIDEVIQGSASDSFGESVWRVSQQLPDEITWLWLLHDDLEPQHDALYELLVAASSTNGDPDAAPDLLYPKLLMPQRRNYPKRLSEIGQSISSTSRRVLTVEPGDIDQDQHIAEATLGGSTAGMFVRRKVWNDLGGLATELPVFRDGLDFGWRANDAGHQVLTAPKAALHHLQAGRTGYRHSELIGDPEATDRTLGLQTLISRARTPGLTTFGLVLFSLLRALGYLLGKAPSAARSELRAIRRVVSGKEVTTALADRGAGHTKQAELRPVAGAGLSYAFDRLGSAFTERQRDLDASDTSIDDLTGDDFAGGRRRGAGLAPTMILVASTIILAAIAARELFGRGSLVSTDLLPSPDSISQAWAGWIEALPGHVGANAPWLGLHAFGSTLALASPELWARLVMILGPVAAALTAQRAAKLFLGQQVATDGRPVGRWTPALVGGVWALVGVMLGAVSRGSMSGMVMLIVLPLAAASFIRWRREDVPESIITGGERWRAPATFALWMGLMGLSHPLFWGLAIIAAAHHAITSRHVDGKVILAGLAPVVMASPWIPRILEDPSRMLATSGPTAQADPTPIATWGLLFGRVSTAGLPPLVLSIIFFGLISAAALMGVINSIATRRHTGTVLQLFAVAATAVVTAALLSRGLWFVGKSPIRADLESWMLIAFGAMILLALMIHSRGDGVVNETPDPDDTDQIEAAKAVAFARIISLIAFGLVCAIGIAWWVIGGARGPLRLSETVTPNQVASAQNSPRQTRALLIDTRNGEVAWNLSADGAPRWGFGELSGALGNETANTLTQQLVAQFAAGQPSDELASRLASLGIAHVWMKGAPADRVAALANTPGLVASDAGGGATLWTVQGLISRAMVSEPNKPPVPVVDGYIAAGSSNRTLRLAEVFDDRWRITVGGNELVTTSDTSGFGVLAELGDASGEVKWTRASQWWAVWIEAGTVVLLLLLAAPSVRTATQGRRSNVAARRGTDG